MKKMKMNKRIVVKLLVIAIAMALAACEGAPTVIPPTATLTLPTNTPRPLLTATPVLPVLTATPVPPVPTATPVPRAPTATPVPGVPTATPVPRMPTATPVPLTPTATPVPPLPTATPLSPLPTATPVTPAPTPTPLPEALRGKTLVATLIYLPQSNAGPEDATGLATLEVTTGQVEVQVEDLPPLTDGFYEGWLVNQASGAMLSVGVFNTDAEGKGGLSVSLGDQTGAGWDFFILTIEPEPDPSPDPAPDRSIGGPFRPLN
jgi:hypothetical protein